MTGFDLSPIACEIIKEHISGIIRTVAAEHPNDIKTGFEIIRRIGQIIYSSPDEISETETEH